MRSPNNFNNKYCAMTRSVDGMLVNDYNEFSAVFDDIMADDFAGLISSFYADKAPTVFPDKRFITVLDLGCGTGSFLRTFKNSYGKDSLLVGMDKSDGQLDVADKKAEEQGIEISFRNGSLSGDSPRNLRSLILDHSADLITMNMDVINHINEPENWYKIFSNIYSCLDPDGILLFDMNTHERILNDWNQPEIIIKSNMTYVQVSSDPVIEGDWVSRKLYMEVFKEESDNIRRYAVLVEQTAPTKELLFDILKNAGFSRVEENHFSQEIRGKHIIMKNRLFVEAYK